MYKEQLQQRLFIEFHLLKYLSENKSDDIHFIQINPVGLKSKEVFDILKDIFYERDLYNIISFKNTPTLDLNISSYNINDFFYNSEYIKVSEKKLFQFGFGMNMGKKKELRKQYEGFMNATYSNYYNSETFKQEVIVLYDKIERLYDLHGDEFEFSSKNFNGKEVCFMASIIAFIHLGLIDIIVPWHNAGKVEEYRFTIKIKGNLLKVIKSLSKTKEAILSRIFTEKYEKIVIKKKKGKLDSIESEISYLPNETNYSKLKNKYPHSDITGINYKGETKSYKVKEKIKIDKETE